MIEKLPSAKQSKAEKIRLIHLLDEKISRDKRNRLSRVYESFYWWQRKFNAATRDHHECLLLAANQVGKTRTGTSIDAYHLLGTYPDDWEGHAFKRPPMCWLLGYSGEKTRDLLQNALLGRFTDGAFEGGLIPAEKVVDWRSMTGTPGAMREVRVKHKSGGISTCKFWSYSQGQHALMGDVVDWFHIDEEPEDDEIQPQVLTRTINGDEGRGGRGIYTFTPENGKTMLVCSFMEDPSDDQYMINATWKDAPHITQEKRERLLASYPAHQRKMRSEGQPLMGAGLIYDVDEDLITTAPFPIPDHWFIIDGMDFGWDHPQAHIQMVWNRDDDAFFIVNAWKDKNKQPFEAWHRVKVWAEDVPTAWPQDGLQTEKGSAKQQKSYYSEEGFNMLESHATWDDGSNGVWAGIMEINNLMSTGRFKVFSNLHGVLEEIRQYHTVTTRDGNSKIVKVKDDFCDSVRYAFMMRRHAIRICDLEPDEYNYTTPKQQGRDNVTGY